MSAFLAGTAREEITPPPGIDLSGFAGRSGPNTDCRDPLYASALYLHDGRTGALVLTLDLIGLTPNDDASLRTQIAANIGISPDAVLVACSHTHSGPQVMPLRATGVQDLPWTKEVIARAGRAAAAARQAAQPAALRYGGGQCFAAINRRQSAGGGMAIGQNPQGPCDTTCRILMVEGEFGPLAIVAQYAMHPVILGNDSLRASADWVGAMRAKLEQTLGCPALFLQGCCGDINPRVRGTEAICDEVGLDVAGSVLSALPSLTPMENPVLSAAAATAEIPVRPLPSDEELAEVERSAQAALADSAAALAHRQLAQAHLDWAAACRGLRQSGQDSDIIPGRVSALNIGDIILVGLPGEIFTEIGFAVQQASLRAWPIGYASGNLGYLYTDEAFKEGGYEVESAYRLYGERQADRGTSQSLADAARKAMQAL